MDEPIEELYFNWLYSKVASIKVLPTPSLTYLTLLRDLHSTEFVWLVSGDDNRAEEGMDLRAEFFRVSYLDRDPPWLSIPCSVLEMMIALSRRASYDTDISERDWFWTFLTNLGIEYLSDNHLGITQIVDEVLDMFVWRTYDAQGKGGMFPLSKPAEDQTKRELWYQFCDYLMDQDLI